MVFDHLETVWQGWAAAGAGLNAEQWSYPTRLPGWTVKDLYCHHAGFPRALAMLAAAPAADGAVTQADAAGLIATFNRPGGAAHQFAEHVRDQAVQHARQHSRDEIIAQFTSVGPEALAAARQTDPARPIDWFGIAVAPFGAVVRIVLLEAVVHYLDLARAVGLAVPGPVEGDPLRETVALLAQIADPVTFVERATGRIRADVFPVMR